MTDALSSLVYGGAVCLVVMFGFISSLVLVLFELITLDPTDSNKEERAMDRATWLLHAAFWSGASAGILFALAALVYLNGGRS